jgi:hypothetical protein
LLEISRPLLEISRPLLEISRPLLEISRPLLADRERLRRLKKNRPKLNRKSDLRTHTWRGPNEALRADSDGRDRRWSCLPPAV